MSILRMTLKLQVIEPSCLKHFNNFGCYNTTSLPYWLPSTRYSRQTPSLQMPQIHLDQEYKLTSVEVMPEGYHLEILSRWDDIVFEAKDEIKGWDGKMKNGNWAPAGVYCLGARLQ